MGDCLSEFWFCFGKILVPTQMYMSRLSVLRNATRLSRHDSMLITYLNVYLCYPSQLATLTLTQLNYFHEIWNQTNLFNRRSFALFVNAKITINPAGDCLQRCWNLWSWLSSEVLVRSQLRCPDGQLYTTASHVKSGELWSFLRLQKIREQVRDIAGDQHEIHVCHLHEFEYSDIMDDSGCTSRM